MHTYLLCLLMNSFFIMFQSLPVAIDRFKLIILPKSFQIYAISFSLILKIVLSLYVVIDTHMALHYFVILCKLSLFSFIHVFMNLYLILYSILKGHLIIRKKTPIITRNIPRIYISTFTFLLLETLLVNNFFQV